MGKKDKKKKPAAKGSLLKRLLTTAGIAVAVIFVMVLVVNAINKSSIKYITIEGAYKELYVGNPEFSSVEVGVNVYPETASTNNLVAYSSDENIAKVKFDGSKLKIEAVSTGTATIKVSHASKSKLNDYIQIEVKDVDVQDLEFTSLNESGESVKIEAVDVKKDGFEHFIKFDLNPIDANMNNLKVSYDESVLENAYIDQASRSLVVVPKIDIIQTSTAVDIEIYQHTSAGYVAAQYTRLQLNLKAREAYIRFNLSSDPTKGYSLNHNNIIYLEQENAPNVYVLPDIGYDVNYGSIGTFSTSDYNLYIDGNEVEFDSSGIFSYQNKLRINKNVGNYYYFDALPAFISGDNIYVTFEHKFTGAIQNLQFIYLATESIGLSTDQTFSIETKTTLELNEVVAVNFSYDNGVKYKVVEIYAFKRGIDENGKEIRIPASSFGDEQTDETIVVEQIADKIFLRAKNLTDSTIIQFGVKCDYWDTRYVRFDVEGLYESEEFRVVNSVTDLVVEQNGAEVSFVEIVGMNNARVKVFGLPYGNNNLNMSLVTFIVTKGGVASNDVTVTYDSDKNEYVIHRESAASGVYELTFNYNTIQTRIFIEVK